MARGKPPLLFQFWIPPLSEDSLHLDKIHESTLASPAPLIGEQNREKEGQS